MVIQDNITLQEKLEILAASAKFDVACTSSGVQRAGKKGQLGNSVASGICHSFGADGRCISLLKILYTNECIYNCRYCINRCTNDVPRATFTPEEVCTLTIEFYRRNYIEGLFLSSGVIESPDYTMELICHTLKMLRQVHRFNGYIHCKAIPGASSDLIEEAGWYADRMSVNLELPTERGLLEMAPNKSRKTILTPMRQIQSGMAESRELLGMKGGNRSAYWYTQKRAGRELPGSFLDKRDGIESIKGIEGESVIKGAGEYSGYNAEADVEKKQNNIQNLSQKGIKEENNGSAGIELKCENNGSAGMELKEANNYTGKVQAGKSTSLTKLGSRDISRGFVPAGQSTQMIIGATGESDYEILSVTEALYQRFDLKRVFYSAFVNVNQDSNLPMPERQPIRRREHRLYQADFLLRFYGFQAMELLSAERPFFNTFLDPKCDWALRHLEQFPVEINTADYDTLLRVPGIGAKSAQRIVAARRSGQVDYVTLKKIGVVMKRAIYFITCNGKMMYHFMKIDEDYITRNLLHNDRNVMEDFGDKVTYRQLSLFDCFGGQCGSLE